MIQKIARLYRAGLLGLAVKGEMGRWISCAGEILGSEDLIFNSCTYAAFHKSALERAPVTIPFILQLYPGLRKVVDLGCGTGVFVEEFLKHNVHAEGFEYSDKARKIARDSFGIEEKPFDMNTFSAPEGDFDLCICCEVAHYLPAAMGDKLVKICAECAPLVVFPRRTQSRVDTVISMNNQDPTGSNVLPVKDSGLRKRKQRNWRSTCEGILCAGCGSPITSACS